LIPRLAFAGLGWIGKHRMQAVRESGKAEVAMLCDPLDPATCSFEQLLLSDVDAIVIATPSALRADH
jgi:predicted dehydrogenase